MSAVIRNVAGSRANCQMQGVEKNARTTRAHRAIDFCCSGRALLGHPHNPAPVSEDIAKVVATRSWDMLQGHVQPLLGGGGIKIMF